MRAAQVHELNGPRGVLITDVPRPVAATGEVLVEVAAAGLSFPDLLMSKGEYQFKPPVPYITGGDFAGVVRASAPEWNLAAGDRVVGAVTHGAAAEFVAVTPDRLFPLPDRIGFTTGAGMPLTYLTAHFALLIRGGAQPGDWVQVNGAAGGVGTAAVLVAKAIGCHVVAMVADEAEAGFVRTLSPDAVVIGPSSEAVRAATDGRGVDVVLDVVGTDEVVLEGLRSLTETGRLLTLGYVGGSIPSVRLNRLLLGNIDVRGVAWGPYTRAHPGFAQRQWQDIVGWIEAGALTPLAADVRPLTEAADGLSDLAERRVRGKIVLDVAAAPLP